MYNGAETYTNKLYQQDTSVTKYGIVERWIKDGLYSGRFRPGDMLPSESELGSQLSVARNSVRQALRNLSVQGFVETRKGIGTFCLAPDNVRNRSRDVALLCYSTNTYIFPKLISTCMSVFDRAGYHMLVNQTGLDTRNERRMLESFHTRGVAGILMEPVYSGEGDSNRELILRMVRDGVAIVLIDNYFPDVGLSYVALNDAEAGRVAVSHLLDNGHRKIGITYTANYYPKMLRCKGALEVLAENGIEVPEHWRIAYEGLHSSDAVYGYATEVLKNTDDRPTAFFCSSDEEAMDVAHAAEDLDLKIPDDLSIVGVDNSELGRRARVPLTTIDHPTQYMAELATSLLVQAIRYASVTSQCATLINPELIERNSVSRPPR